MVDKGGNRSSYEMKKSFSYNTCGSSFRPRRKADEHRLKVACRDINI